MNKNYFVYFERISLVLILSVVVVLFVYIASLSPIVGDTWGFVIQAQNPEKYNPFVTQWKSYLGGNPRIGSLFLRFGSQSQSGLVVTNVLGVMSVAYFASLCILGRWAKPTAPLDVSVMLGVLAITILTNLIPARMFFYAPFNTNYVLAFGFTLSVVAIVRFRAQRAFNGARDIRALDLLIFLYGVFWGLSNEHTIPAIIALLVLGALSVMWLEQNFSLKNTWAVMRDRGGLAALGLFIGYLLLFFAPGQQKRYGGIKYDAISTEVGDYVSRGERIWSYLFIDENWSFALGAILLTTVFFVCLNVLRGVKRHDYKVSRSTVFWLAFFFLGGLLMALTLLMSPKQGPRLLFASNVCIAIFTIWLSIELFKFAGLSERFIGYMVGTPSLIVIISHIIYVKPFYETYNKEFVERSRLIKSQVRSGGEVVIPPYGDIVARKNGYILQRESVGSERINGLIIRYYRAEIEQDQGR